MEVCTKYNMCIEPKFDRVVGVFENDGEYMQEMLQKYLILVTLPKKEYENYKTPKLRKVKKCQ